jgi:uncharacterized protein involved in exopolysaccharide biosynthesis
LTHQPIQSPELTFEDLREWLLPHRRYIALGGFLGAVAVASVLLTRPRTYTVPVSFVPQASSSGGLGGLAAQFGLSFPASDAAQNPLFYTRLISSEGFIRDLIRTPVNENGRMVRIGAMLGVQDTSLAGERAAVKRAYEAVGASSDAKTGIVMVNVRTRWPEASKAIADQVLAQIQDFNENIRRSRASAERIFAGERARELQSELRQAEERLRGFLERNRDVRYSPELTLENERLLREVARIQAVYLSVLQAYEQARLDEVHEAPVITVVEAPRLPLAPDSRRVGKRSVAGSLAGGFLGLLLSFGLRLRRNSRV